MLILIIILSTIKVRVHLLPKWTIEAKVKEDKETILIDPLNQHPT